MITGELRNKVDNIWDTLWTGGITSPITVLEQITYLMFMKLLDDNQLKKEANANALGVQLKNKTIIPEYAYYLFSAQSWDEGTNRAVMGATLNKSTLSKYRVYIHDVEQQREIIHKLDKVTKAIGLRRKQIGKIDDIVKSQFIEMFGDIVRNERGWQSERMEQIAPAEPYRGHIASFDGKYWLLNLDMVEAQTGEIISKVMVDTAEIGNSTTTFGSENVSSPLDNYSKIRSESQVLRIRSVLKFKNELYLYQSASANFEKEVGINDSCGSARGSYR